MHGVVFAILCPRRRAYSPAILQTAFHSSAVTGCTDSREYFTSAMAASFLSALMAAIVTGFGSGLSALMSTQTNFPVLSVGIGIGLLDDLGDADDLLALVGMVEERLVALLHVDEILPRGEIAHAGPGFALGALCHLLSHDQTDGSDFTSQYAIVIPPP